MSYISEDELWNRYVVAAGNVMSGVFSIRFIPKLAGRLDSLARSEVRPITAIVAGNPPGLAWSVDPDEMDRPAMESLAWDEVSRARTKPELRWAE